MAKCGRNYPAHEVDYEQSIVAPAAIYMCELYQITGEETYLAEAARQLQVLELFQGDQPDYHLNQVAIRHWDGYWFGKRKLLGDTFPHYWSSLSGWAYRAAGQIPQLEAYGRRAEATLRGVLSLFGEGWKRLLRHGISHERQWTAGAFLRSLGQRSGLGPVLCGEVSGGLIFPGKTS